MKKAIWVITLCMMVSLLLTGEALAHGEGVPVEHPETFKGKVHSILVDKTQSYGDGYEMRYQIAEIEMLEGEHKGRVLQVQNDITAYNLVLSEGDEVLLFLEEYPDGTLSAYVSDIARGKYLIWISVIFLVLLALIGGVKGIKTIVALLLTVAGALFVLLPLVAKGKDPITVSTLVCFAVTIVTLVILNGFSLKTLAAIIGTSSGILIAGLLAWIFSYIAKLTGMGNEYAQLLVGAGVSFDFKGLLFAAIMLGSLGAVMDVSMSIASSMNEIICIEPGIRGWRLFKHGMNIGRDMMGTMSNTLILAYVGGALHLLLCFMVDGVPFREIISKDLVASEVVRSVAGSIGLISAVPLTALVTMFLSRNAQIVVKNDDAA
jgi:uncharacterized membrane protein